MMFIRAIGALGLMFVCGASWAQLSLGPVNAGSVYLCKGLEKRCAKSVAQGAFRVFYRTEGDHAVPIEDRNGNGIPDRVDDLLMQLVAADWLYQTQLGLTGPLQQDRYARATGIEIHLLHFDKGSGLAFDEPTPANWFEGRPSGLFTLKIKMASQVNPLDNPTPAHELFHLYQYGYASFKTRWFTEGMARWLEQPFRKKKAVGVAPAIHACSALKGMAYGASGFFEELANKFGSEHVFSGETTQQSERFSYSDGSRVIDMQNIGKYRAVKPWLEMAHQLTMVEGERLGLKHGSWPEALQRSDEFDERLCRALKGD